MPRIGSRHNVGFHLVDEIAEISGLSFRKKLFSKYLYAEGMNHEGATFRKIVLVKPLTYMNNSGTVIPDILRNYGEDVQFLVAADNMDLPPGIVRLKRRGGTAGHNGLKSVTEYLDDDFWPLYIGVGHPGTKSAVTSHVMEKMNRHEQVLYKRFMPTWAGYILKLSSEPFDTVLQNINSSRNDDSL